MNADIVIRRERPDQPEVVDALDALDRYLATLYPPEANHILDVASLCGPEVCFLVARDAQGVLCGTAAFRTMAPEPQTRGLAYGEVKRMYVNPASRGQGIGLRLLQALEDAMRVEGLTQALLETGADQHEAVRLYRRAGYRPHDAFGGYPDNGLSLFFVKALA